MDKTAILETANNLITGARADSYGDFQHQMGSISGMYNNLKGVTAGSPRLEPRDVALILILLKLKRLDVGWDLDSAVDTCGYMALLGESYCRET